MRRDKGCRCAVWRDNRHCRAAAGYEDVITIDIGGTSADIALVSGGQPLIAPEGKLDGYAVRVLPRNADLASPFEPGLVCWG